MSLLGAPRELLLLLFILLELSLAMTPGGDVGAVAENQLWVDMICMRETSGRSRQSAGRSGCGANDPDEVSDSIRSKVDLSGRRDDL
jgi:hypothetical protein